MTWLAILWLRDVKRAPGPAVGGLSLRSSPFCSWNGCRMDVGMLWGYHICLDFWCNQCWKRHEGRREGRDGTGYCSSQIVLQPKYAAENATVWNPHGTRKHTCGDIITLTSDGYQHAVWGRSVEKICPLTADGFPTYSFGRIAIHAILKPKQQSEKNPEMSPKAQSPLYDHIPRPQTCTDVPIELLPGLLIFRTLPHWSRTEGP